MKKIDVNPIWHLTNFQVFFLGSVIHVYTHKLIVTCQKYLKLSVVSNYLDKFHKHADTHFDAPFSTLGLVDFYSKPTWIKSHSHLFQFFFNSDIDIIVKPFLFSWKPYVYEISINHLPRGCWLKFQQKLYLLFKVNICLTLLKGLISVYPT